MKTSTAALNGSVKKGGVVVTLVFSAVTDKPIPGISLAWSFSGPEEAMKSLFSSWPINFDDVKGTCNAPIEIDATLALSTVTAGATANAMATAAAGNLAPSVKKDDAAPSIEKVGAEIEKIAAQKVA